MYQLFIRVTHLVIVCIEHKGHTSLRVYCPPDKNLGRCTHHPIDFQLQIKKRKSKNDSLSDFSFFNSKTKMNYKVVFRLLYTY